MSDIMDLVESWPLSRVEALYRVAKKTGFFTDPRMMIRLREIMQRKQAE